MKFFLPPLHNKKRISVLLGQIFPRWQVGWRWLLGVGLTAIIISSCGGVAINHNEALTAKPSSTPCRVVQHAIGETCVPNNPQRVVTLIHHLLGHALTLEVKPIGSNARSIEQVHENYLDTQDYLGNKTEGIALTGIAESPNLEKILKLKPDLILATEFNEDIYSLLSQTAPVVIAQYKDIVLNWKEGFKFTAKILGKEEKAQQALGYYNRQIEKLKISISDRYQGRTISVFGIDNVNIFVFAKNSFPGSILSDLGLKRPTVQDVTAPNGAIYQIPEERLDWVDGDVLFFLAYSEEDRKNFERLKQKPLWNKLKAIQQGQVYLVDGYTWTGSNLLAADAVINDLYKYLVNTP